MEKLRLPVVLLLIVFALFSCSKKPGIKPAEPFDPEKAIEKAQAEIQNKNFEEARTQLLEVKSRDLTQKYAPIAQLKIADSYMSEDEPELAISEYKKFLEFYPTNKYASYAQYQIAMAYFIQIEDPERGYGAATKALDEFRKLKELYPRNPYRDVVDLKIERCINIMAEYEFLVGKFYYDRDALEGALERFRIILEELPEYKKVQDVYYYTALTYKKLGNREKALEHLNLVIKNYPESAIAKEAEKELANLKGK